MSSKGKFPSNCWDTSSADAMILNRMVYYWQKLASKNSFESSGAFWQNLTSKNLFLYLIMFYKAKYSIFLHHITKNRAVHNVNSQNRVVQMHHWTRPNGGTVRGGGATDKKFGSRTAKNENQFVFIIP